MSPIDFVDGVSGAWRGYSAADPQGGTLLQISAVDLVALAEALEDHTAEHTWWFDPESGQLELGVDPGDGHVATPGNDLDTEKLIPVDPLPAGVVRRDMLEFLDRVQDGSALARLDAAAESGDGARFTRTVGEYPDLRGEWRAFVDARRQVRAVQWLADEGVVPAAEVDRELAARRAGTPHDPTLRPPGAEATSQRIAAALAGVYGSRLCEVVLVEREGHKPDGEVDLVVVLDRLDSVWTELARMESVLWAETVAGGVVVTALPLGEADVRAFRPSGIPDGARPGAAPGEVAEELAAAHALNAAGLPRTALAHALAAAVLAASRALERSEDHRPAAATDPAALIAALVGLGGGVGRGFRARAGARGAGPAADHHAAARLLRSLYERARAGLEAGVVVGPGEAARAVADAEGVVRALGWPALRAARTERPA
jgi:hypothetical protein